MKKDGIQTRNRKVSNKNKKSKKVAMLEQYQEVAQPTSLDDNGGPFSLGPGTLLTYSHSPHLIPAPSPLHPSASLPYSHHLNTGMVPTLVWKNKRATFVYSGISTPACLPLACVDLYISLSTLGKMWMEFSVYFHCIVFGKQHVVDNYIDRALVWSRVKSLSWGCCTYKRTGRELFQL